MVRNRLADCLRNKVFTPCHEYKSTRITNKTMKSETAILYSSIFKKNDAFCNGKGKETMICFPNIKINLGLHIINRRTDGFHTIESVFVPVNYTDILEVIEDTKAAKGEIRFTATGLPVEGKPENNLI